MKVKEKPELTASRELAEKVRSEVDDLILYFSCGKESIAMWLFLREFGFNIIPVFLYVVPCLRSDRENLAYYEDYFGQEIMRLPHMLFYQMLNDFVYQPPERCAQIMAWDLPYYGFADIDKVVALDKGLDSFYSAMGMRMADNLDRRMMMYQNGVLGTKARRFYYPIWDWNIQQVADIIKLNKIKLPKSYRFSGRTLAAIDYEYIKPFKENYPDDYKIYLEWFPLLEAEFYRYEVLGHGKKDKKFRAQK